jgi:hypothetical protein
VSAAAQTITVTGSNFQAGLTLIMTPPPFVSVSSVQAQSVTATSFQVSNVLLSQLGTYTFQVKNPSGDTSNAVKVSTQFRTSGATWIPEGVRLTDAQNNPPGGGIADVMAFQLSDGRWRLVYNAFSSAISPDGLSLTVETPSHGLPNVGFDGSRIQPTLPRVLALSNGLLRAYFGCGNGTTGCSGPNAGIVSAVSNDQGLTWTMESGVRIPLSATGQTQSQVFLSGLSVVPTRDGRWRGYFSTQIPMLTPTTPAVAMSATSTDLLNWTLDAGVRIGTGAALSGIPLHAKAIANSDGSITLFYWRPQAMGGGAMYTSTSADGLIFTTETLLESLGVAGDPDVVRVGNGLRIYYNWGNDSGGAIYSALNASGTIGTAVIPNTVDLRRVMATAAAASASADSRLVRALTDQAIDALSPLRVPADHSLRERIARAEDNFRHNQHAAISEDAAVDALNALADAMGAPTWAYTNANQLHPFRRELNGQIPLLVDMPSSGGAMASEMSPLEAVVVTVALANRKLADSTYQAAPDDWVGQLRALGPRLNLQQEDHEPAGLTRTSRWVIEEWLTDEHSDASLNAHALLDRLGLRR